jgi:O-antigen/teichoic acid export membrane protein
LGIVQRQAFQNTIINYVGVVIGFVNIVILFPLFLSEDEFGLTRLVLSMATTMAQISSFGVHRIAIKFFPVFRKEPNKNNGLLVTLLALSVTGFIIVSTIYYLFHANILGYYQDDSALFRDYYMFIPLAALGFLMFIVFESFLQSLRKTVFTNLLRNVIIRIVWLAFLILYYYGFCNFFQFMILFMLGYFFTAALCIWQLVNIKEFVFDINPDFSRKRIIKPMINYGLYTLLSGTTLILVTNVDLLMIGALMPEEKLKNIGIYAIATYIVSIIFIPTISLTRISAPIVAYDWRKRNLKNIEEFYKKSSVILAFLGGMIFGGIAINLHDLLSFMKPEYSQAYTIILVLGLARVFDMASGLNLVILTVTRFYRVEAILAIFLLTLVIITNYIFIPIYGINGAAIATAIVFLTYNIILFLFIWAKLKMQPYSWGTFNMLLFGAVAGILVWYIPTFSDNKILMIIFRSSVFVILYFTPVYFLKISPDINQMTNNIISKISGRKTIS